MTNASNKLSKKLVGLVISTIIVFSLIGCSQLSYPVQRDNHDGLSIGTDGVSYNYMHEYDTIITSRGDTAVIKVPYRPSTVEKAGLLVLAAFVYWCIDISEEAKK